MSASLPDGLTEGQRQFLSAARRLGATSAAGARPLPAWPRLPARELDELVERGLIREAPARTYYAAGSPPRDGTPLPSGPPAAVRRRTGGWLLRQVAFWLLVVLMVTAIGVIVAW